MLELAEISEICPPSIAVIRIHRELLVSHQTRYHQLHFGCTRIAFVSTNSVMYSPGDDDETKQVAGGNQNSNLTLTFRFMKTNMKRVVG